MQLEDKLYTSTEVAEILGVSLRSVYRYLEDGKLKAEVKTATGRHRFTKDNIVDFLYPGGNKDLLIESSTDQKFGVSSQIKESEDISKDNIKIKEQKPVKEEKIEEEEPVDWLSKFREAATKYREEPQTPRATYQEEPRHMPIREEPVARPIEPEYIPPMPQVQLPPQMPQMPQMQQTPQRQNTAPVMMFYRSMLGGLKDIAQNLDKSARNSNLDYAFTLNAGASLHKPIKPFATLHAYVRSTDRDFFEKILRLAPATKANAQLTLILSDNQAVYSSKDEIHGLYVVSKDQLRKDISTFGEPQLMQEMADVL